MLADHISHWTTYFSVRPETIGANKSSFYEKSEVMFRRRNLKLSLQLNRNISGDFRPSEQIFPANELLGASEKNRFEIGFVAYFTARKNDPAFQLFIYLFIYSRKVL